MYIYTSAYINRINIDMYHKPKPRKCIYMYACTCIYVCIYIRGMTVAVGGDMRSKACACRMSL